MKDRQEFDDLARRKLEVREFAFEEAAWQDMQRMLAGRRRNRGAWLWWTISGAALLLIGFMAWWSMSTEPAASIVASHGAATAPRENSVPAAEGQEGTPGPQDRPKAAPKAVEIAPAIERPVVAAPVRTTPEQPRSEGPVIDQRTTSATPDSQYTAPTGTATEQAAAVPHVEPGTETPSIVDEVFVPVEAPANTNAVGVVEPGIIAPVTVTILAGNEPSGSAVTLPSEPVTEAPSSEQSANNENVPAPVLTGADTAAATTANGPTEIAAAAAPIPVAMIAASSPWEISVLGGYFNTASDYSGPGSDTWDVTGQQTAGFCGEWMHMGRNFGLGTGLHYGTYADRLITPEEYRTIFTSAPSWYLVPVDTTVLIITGYDPITGTYTGQSVEMTINELRTTLDSTYADVLVREARERINRTSYLELPLLLDAHLVQGRWSLGLRGGPTIGLLTQRQGSIPSDDADGYTEFNHVAMRSLTFGWTARAYVRYRFNSAWSVGIEPSARGQLVDGLDDQGVTRRSNAIGGMISLSYRLP